MESIRHRVVRLWESGAARQDGWISALLFGIVLSVYAATMCRTIYTGDDGDFISAMATLGTPHPTGYPLFCLLGHLTLKLLAPLVPDPAMRINLLTVLFGALAAPTFYHILRALSLERPVAICGTLLFAFAPTLWQQCLSCEVYALTAFYLSMLLLLTTRWLTEEQSEIESINRLCRMAFLYGLAATNHLTIILFFPGFLILVFTRRPDLLPWRNGRVFFALVGLFLLPLSLYMYLPLTARYGHAPLKWGNPTTPEAFWNHLTGQQYRQLMAPNLTKFINNFRWYLRCVGNEYSVVLLGLVPFGIASLWKRQKSLCLLLLYTYLVNVIFNVNYDIADIYVYYIPSYLVVALFFTLGASSLFRGILTRFQREEAVQNRYRRLLAPVFCVLPIVYMSLHFAETDKSGNYLERDVSGNILVSAPPHSVVLVTSEIEFSMWYHRIVLHERPDVVPINPVVLAAMFQGNRWYYNYLRGMYPAIATIYPSHIITDNQLMRGDFMITMIHRGLERGEAMLVVSDDPRFYTILNTHFDHVPWGLTERLYEKGQAPSPERVVAENERIWRQFSTRGLYTGWAHNDDQQERIPLRYANAGVRFAEWAEKVKRWDIADAAYAQASRLYRIPAADAGRLRCARALGNQVATR